MFERIFGKNHDLVLVFAVLGILLILFAPIPAPLLDLMIISNFALALSVLLLTFYVARPVAFSTFPSLLLVATLFRLSLNVAATRLILTGANAGDVIGAIGAFAVQGSFVVGLVVFFILVVVQYVVVTSGAQRVSEVAARFVLDSVPGQQMSIDADLNMGLIDQNEAKRRRKELEKEAAFYGAMDGASKFVKGDAVAGIIILLIDILAGWAVGVGQMGMDWSAALETFTLLTIGDGIVTQVPALVISVATGIIVTRSSADRQLSMEMFSQLSSVPKIPLIVLGALALLLALPGMPKWPIAVLALLAVGAFAAARRRRQTEEEEALFDAQASEPDAATGGRSAVPPIEVQLGRELAQRWLPMKAVIAERIAALRTQQEKLTGLTIPSVSLVEDAHLSAMSYEIVLHGTRYGNGAIEPDATLAIHADRSDPGDLAGVVAKDPAFGLPGLWIADDDLERARERGYTLIDPVTVLMTHLGEILRNEAPNLLSRADVVAMLEGVRTRQPGLIEELVPAVMTVSDIQRVLQNLLAEEVSIRPIDRIAEALVDLGRTIKDLGDLSEHVRQRLSHAICQSLRGQHETLSVVSLDPRLEGQIMDSVRKSAPGSQVVLEPRMADQLIRKLITQAEAMVRANLAPVVLCSPEIRRYLKTFTRRSVPRLSVVSASEIPHSIDLASFGVVGME